MKKIILDNQEYELIKDVKDGFNLQVLEEKYTDYFKDYDYIVGDWAYSKLRLKGFNDKNNPNYKRINDKDNIDKYIEEQCAYGCKHFIIHKI